MIIITKSKVFPRTTYSCILFNIFQNFIVKFQMNQRKTITSFVCQMYLVPMRKLILNYVELYLQIAANTV